MGTQQQAVDALQLDKNAHTIGGLTPAVAQMSGMYLGQLEVNGGYVFVSAGTGATLPTTGGEFQMRSINSLG